MWKNTSLDEVCFSSFTYTDMFHSCFPSAEFTLLIDRRGPVWSHVVKIPVTYVFSVLLNIIKGIINYVYICFVTNSYAFMLFMSFPCLYHEKLGYYIG